MFVQKSAFFAALALAPLCAAQEWEIGAMAGYGFTPTSTISNGSGSVDAGLKSGPVFGATLASNDYRWLGGEATYLYRMGDLKLSGSAKDAGGFGAHTQFGDFRLLVHFAERGSPVRPFVAGGGGVAVYTGTGQESSGQPLNSFAALTATRQLKPMVSAAAGVKVRISQHVGLRLEVRDLMTPFPDQVIAPVPGTTAGGWLHNVMPMVAVVGVF
jgi:hypothetical protein